MIVAVQMLMSLMDVTAVRSKTVILLLVVQFLLFQLLCVRLFCKTSGVFM